MRTPATLSHRSQGRMRLKIGKRQGDSAYFARLADELAAQKGVRRVNTSAESGSLMVEYDPEIVAIDDLLGQFFELKLPLDVSLGRQSGRNAGVRPLKVVVVAALAVYGVWRLLRR